MQPLGADLDGYLVRTARFAATLAASEGEVEEAVFPEGTTTDGTTVGRFFPALFQAAIDARAPVQPVALRYRDAHGRPSAAPAFVGDTTVLASVRQVLREPVLSAEAILGPSLDPAGRTRPTSRKPWRVSHRDRVDDRRR